MRLRSLGLATLVAIAACQSPLDVTPDTTTTGTLGEEIFEIFCQRVASEENPTDVSGRGSRALCTGEAAPETATTPRLRTMATHRARLVGAIDAALYEETHDDLRELLIDILPLYDEEVLPGQTRALAAELAALASDPAVTSALGRFSRREGYRRMELAVGVTRPSLAYSRIDDVLEGVLHAIDEGGVAHDAWQDVLRATAFEMATAAPYDTAEGPSNVATIRDLLFRSDAAFAGTTPELLAFRDHRGVALPFGVVPGTVPLPFRDMDSDGLPDLTIDGDFLSAGGALLALPPPFRIEGETGVTRDAEGRALDAMGGLVWQYVDADRTLGAALLREMAPWLDVADPTALDLIHAVPAVLGPRGARSEPYGAAALGFVGPNTDQSPLFDLLHGAAALFPRAQTVDALRATELLLADEEAAAAGLIATGLYGDAQADLHPEAMLAQPNVFWDELLDVVRRMAQTNGQTEAVVRAVVDPRTQDLDEIIALFMRNRDAVSFNLDPSDGVYDPTNAADRDAMNSPIAAGPVTTPVDRAQPDMATNESLLQRSVYLIHDLNGVRYCNKDGGRMVVLGLTLGTYDECEFLEIENVAQAYAQSVLGRYEMRFNAPALQILIDFMSGIGLGGGADAILELLTGIDGLTRFPTPEALARFVFAPRNAFLQNLFDDLRSGDGAPVEDRHCIGRATGNRTSPCRNAVIFAWEKPIRLSDGRNVSFLDALTPILTALDDNEPAGSFFFGDIGSALQRHYPSRQGQRTQRANPAGTGFSHRDDIRSYEPLTSEIFVGGQLLHRLRAAVVALDGITVRSGVDGVDAIAALTELLTDGTRSCDGSCPTGSLRNRDGRDHICWNDGTCFDGQGGRARVYPSPLYLILDGLSGIDGAWAGSADRHDAWLRARSRIVDQLLTTDAASTALVNRRAHAMILAGTRFARERIEARQAEGPMEVRSWARDLSDDAAAMVGSALGTSLIDLLDTLQGDAAACDALLGLLAFMSDETSDHDAFASTVAALSDSFQILDDEENVIPVLNVLGASFAPNVEEVMTSGGDLAIESSAMQRTIDVLRRVNDVDDARALQRVLAAAVLLPPGGEPVTPLQTIGDVIAEVNRTRAGEGGPLVAEDWAVMLERLQEFMEDDDRGLERIYDVIQNRTVTP